MASATAACSFDNCAATTAATVRARQRHRPAVAVRRERRAARTTRAVTTPWSTTLTRWNHHGLPPETAQSRPYDRTVTGRYSPAETPFSGGQYGANHAVIAAAGECAAALRSMIG